MMTSANRLRLASATLSFWCHEGNRLAVAGHAEGAARARANHATANDLVLSLLAAAARSVVDASIAAAAMLPSTGGAVRFSRPFAGKALVTDGRLVRTISHLDGRISAVVQFTQKNGRSRSIVVPVTDVQAAR